MNDITGKLHNILNNDELEIYSRSSHNVETVSLGSSQWLEVHYYEDGEEIAEVFFYCNGEKVALDTDEIRQLQSLI